MLEYNDGYDDEEEVDEDEFLAEQLMTKEEYMRLQCVKAAALVCNGRSHKWMSSDNEVVQTAREMLKFVKGTD